MKKQRKDFYIIIFCDLVNSSEVAAELSPRDYANKYIKSFYFVGQTTLNFMKKIYKSGWENAHSRFIGDEIVLFKRIEDLDNPEQDMCEAVSFAYSLKLYWLFSPYTIERIKNSRMPREISCGIHAGQIKKITSGIKSSGKTDFGKFASYDINIAKRVESFSRKGNTSYIFATNYVSSNFSRWRDNHIDSYKDGNEEKLKLLACLNFGKTHSVKLPGVASTIDVAESNASEDKDSCDILKNFSELRERYIAVDIMESWFNTLLEQNEDNNPFLPSKKSPFKFNDFVMNEKKLCNYIDDIYYLTKYTANVWFQFNIFYINQAIKKNIFNQTVKDKENIKRYEDIIKDIDTNFFELIMKGQREQEI